MAIAKALNREGVPTASGKAKWTQATVRGILANPVYMGRVGHKGETYAGVHEAIVSEETWRAAEKMRADSVQVRGNGGGRTPAGSHLFTKGLLRCGSCGSAMAPRTVRTRRGGTAQTYFRLGHHRNKELEREHGAE